MPQLQLLREPTNSILTLGASMPMSGPNRWNVTVATSDYDGRSLLQGAWTVPAGAEHADIGLWFKACYDHWFSGDPWSLIDVADREVRRLLRP